MKSLGPLIVGFVAGVFGFSELYIQHDGYRSAVEVVRDYAILLAAMAYILGGVNVVQVNYPKIRRRAPDWQYKLILLGSAAVMAIAGIRWDSFGDAREAGSFHVAASSADLGPDAAELVVAADDRDALVVLDGGQPMRAWHDGDPAAIGLAPGATQFTAVLAPGVHTVTVQRPVQGYASYTTEFTVAAGERVDVTATLPMFWGARSPNLGRVFTWLYDHVFFPCNATMFALLAFYIASAAFRAFRARNTEAALLLGAAILVMIGLVPVGGAISTAFPDIADWIMEVLNTTGRRAIIMGAALGAIATGLRVILGIERAHLGSE